MKKNLLIVAALLLMGATTFGQAVKDRNIIPVAVNLNQVLRMTITNGGNIEFVFNTIDEYENGITGAGAGVAAPMYQTDFTVASSTRWELTYGAEDATFVGTDDPTNQLDLDNVGFSIISNGTNVMEYAGLGNTLGASNYSAQVPTALGEVAALVAYPATLLEDNGDALSNAGDADDNSFTLVWRCGTVEPGSVPMNTVSLIDQATSPVADRYVTNVLFDLAAQ